MVRKLNSYFRFDTELDLDIGNRKYLTEASDASVRNLYRLYSVIAHDGGYHIYLRPKGDRWFKFADEIVEEVDQKEAVEEQYGVFNSLVSWYKLIAKCFSRKQITRSWWYMQESKNWM